MNSRSWEMSRRALEQVLRYCWSQRREQEGAGAGFEILLEPEEGEEVEMVGGFVEEEEVGLHDEQSREVGAHDPTTAEFLGWAGPIGLAVTEAGEHFFGAGFDLGVGEGFVLGVSLEVGGGGDIPGGFAGGEGFFEGLDFARAAGGKVERGLGTYGFGFLREVAEGGPFVALDGAGIALIAAEDEGKNGGFARAVRADERDALAVVDLHVGLFEEKTAAVGFFEIADGQHGRKPVSVGLTTEDTESTEVNGMADLQGWSFRGIPRNIWSLGRHGFPPSKRTDSLRRVLRRRRSV